MNEAYPISTQELLTIAAKEVGKTIPIFGSIVSAHESVFAVIELNRMKLVIGELEQRLTQIEKKTGKPCVLDKHTGQVLLFGCEQVRNDPLVEAKAKAYGGVIAHYLTNPAEMTTVVEVLDSLRKLSVGDLKLLYSLKSGDKFHPNRRVDEMIGYQQSVAPFSDKQVLKEKMVAAFPCFKRLEGLGVIYLAQENVGGIIHDIGALSGYMSMFAHLTPMGISLVRALPP